MPMQKENIFSYLIVIWLCGMAERRSRNETPSCSGEQPVIRLFEQQRYEKYRIASLLTLVFCSCVKLTAVKVDALVLCLYFCRKFA
jgi:hypothetical protein